VVSGDALPALGEIFAALNRKLVGYYGYYG
jgi:hypothetical protein